MGVLTLSQKGNTKMGMDEAHVEHSQKGLSFIQIILGSIMLWCGNKYMPYVKKELPSEEVANATGSYLPITTEVDPCPNGAAYFLYVAGILSLVTAGLHVLTRISYHLAMCDNHISTKEACWLLLLRMGSGVLVLADLVILIWGSVVVFGAWANWTDSYLVYSDNPGEYNYCPHQPMMFAFVILILKWVLIPCIICCAMCCALCIAIISR